jgi:hypothetical protein
LIWDAAAGSPRSNAIVPVVALDSEDPGGLAQILPLLPQQLSHTVIFWLTGFDERAEPVARLRSLWQIVSTYSQDYRLINLYGGYFSIMLSLAGLEGFSNGIGFSESRRWPELAASGAAPARYYVPRLHAFLAPGDAQLLVDQDSWFACTCEICSEFQIAGRPAIVTLDYHDLKRHFVLARKWEIDFVRDNGLPVVISQLEDALDHAETLQRAVIERAPGAALPSRFPIAHLAAWKDAASN